MYSLFGLNIYFFFIQCDQAFKTLSVCSLHSVYAAGELHCATEISKSGIDQGDMRDSEGFYIDKVLTFSPKLDTAP